MLEFRAPKLRFMSFYSDDEETQFIHDLDKKATPVGGLYNELLGLFLFMVWGLEKEKKPTS